jgi:hypothetical protein
MVVAHMIGATNMYDNRLELSVYFHASSMFKLYLSHSAEGLIKCDVFAVRTSTLGYSHHFFL